MNDLRDADCDEKSYEKALKWVDNLMKDPKFVHALKWSPLASSVHRLYDVCRLKL